MNGTQQPGGEFDLRARLCSEIVQAAALELSGLQPAAPAGTLVVSAAFHVRDYEVAQADLVEIE
jgi:hypothetical protein